MSLSRRQVAVAAASRSARRLPLPVPLTPAAPPYSRTLYIAGDSTAAQKYADAAPETGWGMALPFFLRKDPVAVSNHAVNGRSSKSFVDEGRLDVILAAIRPGDFLLVQFAHNDEKAEDPTRYTEPWTTYQDYLRLYIDGARARVRGPCSRPPSSGGGSTRRQRPADATATTRRRCGRSPPRSGVPLLDVQALSLALWQRLGVEETKKYFNWTATEQDNTHFNPPGAIAVARLVARELLRPRVLAPRDVRRLDERIPESWITWPQCRPRNRHPSTTQRREPHNERTEWHGHVTRHRRAVGCTALVLAVTGTAAQAHAPRPRPRRPSPRTTAGRSYGTGTTGGAAADAAHVYTVTTWAEFKAALAAGGSAPKIIKVKGDDRRRLRGLRRLRRARVRLRRLPREYDPAVWGLDDRACSGEPEDSPEGCAGLRREPGPGHQGERPANTTIIGVGKNAGIKRRQPADQGRGQRHRPQPRLREPRSTASRSGTRPTATRRRLELRVRQRWSSTAPPMCGSTTTPSPTARTPTARLPTYFGKLYQQHDGQLDIVRGADYVTASWNVFTTTTRPC